MHLILETLCVAGAVIWSLLKAFINWFVPTKYKSVRGEVCLVTGGGSGIGRLIAIEFAKRGAKLIVWDINDDGCLETKRQIEEFGGEVSTDHCDLSKREEVYDAAQRAKKVFGEVTIVINNAGVVFGKDLLEVKDEQILTTFNVNSLAHFWTVKAFLPSMMQNNHGHIVNIASTLGLFPLPGVPDYVASKYAAYGFSLSLGYELARLKMTGIKTTVVCPYLINTGMFTGTNIRFPGVLPSLTPDETVKKIMHAVLTERDMVCIPRSMYVLYNLATWLPIETSKILYEFMGIYDSFKEFTPTRKYQKDGFL